MDFSNIQVFNINSPIVLGFTTDENVILFLFLTLTETFILLWPIYNYLCQNKKRVWHASEWNIDLSPCVSINQCVVVKAMAGDESWPVSMLMVSCQREEKFGLF